MKGILIRELRILTGAPVNMGLTLLTPIFYGFLFATSLANSVPFVLHNGSTVPYLGWVSPGLGAFTLLMFANMTGPGIYQERASGMLREVASCPVSPLDYVIGKLASSAILSVVEGSVITVVFAWLGGVKLGCAQVASAATLLGLGALALVSLYNSLWGILENGQSASLASSLLTMALLFSSPTFYGAESMTQGVQVMAVLNPLTYILRPLRAVVLGARVEPAQVLILGVLAVALASVNLGVARRSMSHL